MPIADASLSVKVILHNPQGQVLLLRRSRASNNDRGKWEFPGGKIDPHEKFDAALLREVREETGLAIQLTQSFGTCESRHADVHVVYLIMEGLADSSNVKLSSEHDGKKWVDPSALDDPELCPQFRRIARRYAQDVITNPRIKAPGGPAPEKKPFEGSVVNVKTLGADLKKFINASSGLEELSKWIEGMLETLVTGMFPQAAVSARAKAPSSFANKLIVKNKYKNPMTDMTDLIGARIVVHLPSEVEAVGHLIEKEFEIDRANSVDKLKDLGADRFGYRSVHYVVELRKDKPKGMPPKYAGKKVEIQVRTIAQHAWSDIGHDRLYKSHCEVPDYWKREANRIAALLEAADEAFARLVRGISAFETSSAHATDKEKASEQLQLWDVVRKQLPAEPLPARWAVDLAEDLEQWKAVVAIVNSYKGAPNARLICAKGHALCKIADNNSSPQWKEGTKILEKAAALADDDVQPHFQLAQLLAPVNRAQALKHFEAAFRIDSSDPAVLMGYIRCKVLEEKPIAFIPLLRPEIEQAILRSRELADAGGDLPTARYRMAGFHLLLGSEHDYQSLDLFAQAVHETRLRPGMLIQALRDLTQLAEFAKDRHDIECARRFTAAALLARFPKDKWPDDLPKPKATPLNRDGQVVIIAGGCAAHHEAAMQQYGDVLKAAFGNFRGTIISGGTEQGISGLVGKLASESRGRIFAVGYLADLPPDGTATRDSRYNLIRPTDGKGFSSCQPIQSWLDLLASGVRPNDVRLLGINGGNIAGLEYRIAVALGATVGVIEGSGREAELVVNEWPGVSSLEIRSDNEIAEGKRLKAERGRLIPLPCDPATLRAFVRMGIQKPGDLPDAAIEQIAQLLHQDFLEQNRYSPSDPVMKPWDHLRWDFKESNRSHARYMFTILADHGFAVRPFKGTPADPKFTKTEVESMGEEEHGRWNVERLLSGWRFGKPPKNVEKRTSPYICPWNDLSETVRGYDYKNVRLWPELLAEVGYEIHRLPKRPR